MGRLLRIVSALQSRVLIVFGNENSFSRFAPYEGRAFGVRLLPTGLVSVPRLLTFVPRSVLAVSPFLQVLR